MRYNSIGEYFYRLSNKCLVLALLPVGLTWLAFTLNHQFLDGTIYFEIPENDRPWYLGGLAILQLVLLIGLVITSRKRALKLIPEPSLGIRIQRYIPIVMTRFYGFSTMFLTIGISVFISLDLFFLYLLPLPIFSFLIYWPSRRRISIDLKLKMEEREVLKNNSLGV